MESSEIKVTNKIVEMISEEKVVNETEKPNEELQKIDEDKKSSIDKPLNKPEIPMEASTSTETTEIIKAIESTSAYAIESFIAKNDSVSVDPVTASIIAVSSLGMLNQYGSTSGSEEEEEEEEDDESIDKNKNSNEISSYLDKIVSAQNYRVDDSDESDTESDDDTEIEFLGSVEPETIDITNDDELNKFMENCEDETGVEKGPVKAKGELGMADLPPIQDLTISVPESECIHLGAVSGIVDTLVLVESLPNFAAVDIDTVLFLDKGNRTLGQVFDVMGNVSEPIYCVRFNKSQDIVDNKIDVGAIVYVAPKTEHTNFIVLAELMRQRGTDASWEDDIEPPDGCIEYSDDEEERLANRTRRQQQRNRNRPSISSDVDAPTTNKVQVKQEPNMNRSNRRIRRQKPNHRPGPNQYQPNQFYKDNRGYANMPSVYSNYPNVYPSQMSTNYNHSWHTAMQAMNQPGMYPNPYSMPLHQNVEYNHLNNLQLFPPLPPPMNTQPPMSTPSPNFSQNRRFNNRNESQRNS